MSSEIFFKAVNSKAKKKYANCAAGGQIWLMYILKEKSINPSQKKRQWLVGTDR